MGLTRLRKGKCGVPRYHGQMPSLVEAPKGAASSSADSDSLTQYVCVHGHFYQPPRENPWLETVEAQSSASPFHDWNERITAECYAPNGASRITDKQGRITRILNNYARMSFNFGPTLLSWLEHHAPRAYRAILAADRLSAERFSGHGSALAQVYNHVIMPLALPQDARTQIRWGIRDFEHRYGRRPEGMWLAETAVSRSVLDLMAEEGIRFTILAPTQCARVRPLIDKASTAARNWRETSNASVDPTQPYLVSLEQGRSISVFFYDGPTSRAIAFEGLLNSGEEFGRRLLTSLRPSTCKDGRHAAQLAHVATDGESYGHHHRHGEMALSYAMQWIEEKGLARLTNYGEFLANFPPTWEAEVVENSSWSCSHGVERWRSDCGCNGGKPGWHQAWRGPLRRALDFLRDRTATLAEEFAVPLLRDLGAARDAYIGVIVDRSRSNVDLFLAEHATHVLSPAERVTVLELLEMERHKQLMYTSCGWFFDDISGIETVQIIAYAGRVLQLAAKLFGKDGEILEEGFLELLAQAKSNVPEFGDGAGVYKRWVRGARLDLEHVGAHYAISSMFGSYPDAGTIFCFDVQRHSYDVLTSGRGRIGIGRARLRSQITDEAEEICFAVLHLGDQNLSAAVKRFTPEGSAAWKRFGEAARAVSHRANLPELVRLIDEFFGSESYSLASLFADDQQRILKIILNRTLTEVEDSLMRIYQEHTTLMQYLGEINMPAPPALALTAEFAINAGLRRALEADFYDAAEVARLLHRAEVDNVKLDTAMLSYAADGRMKRAMITLENATPAQKLSVLRSTLAIAESLHTLPGPSNLWQAQNIWNDLLHRPESRRWGPDWRDTFYKLGEALKIVVKDVLLEEGAYAGKDQ